MLQNAVDAGLHSDAENLIVVLGAEHEETYDKLVGTKAEVVVNESWEKGIGSSIKCGLQKLIKSVPDLEAVIISVCDQPFLSNKVFNLLIDVYKRQAKKIVASNYKDSHGVPVLYDKEYFNELMQIPDQHGAKKFIVDKASDETLGTIPFPKGEVDIDTIEDIKNLSKIESMDR